LRGSAAGVTYVLAKRHAFLAETAAPGHRSQLRFFFLTPRCRLIPNVRPNLQATHEGHEAMNLTYRRDPI
jgi:hypothetical protein